MSENKKNDLIDFVIMWVDGNDPDWIREKSNYKVSDNADGTIYRYRDWGLLKYWFRGVEKFAPWVNKVYFVTWGHIPAWLNTNNEKLVIVNHKDYIPEKYLPTFSANTIENNLHRIKGLSDRFVLFNDDMYLISNVSENDFFWGNIPMDTIGLNVHCPQKSLISQYFCINDTSIINEHFDFKKSLRNNILKWLSLKNGKALLRTLVLMNCPRYPGFWQHHLPSAYCKNTFETVWALEPEILQNTCEHKFRETSDVNQWLFREWQIADGNIRIRNSKFGESFYIDRDGIDILRDKIISYIIKQKGKVIAINDGPMEQSVFDDFTEKLNKAFQKILPEKSMFEKEEENENQKIKRRM